MRIVAPDLDRITNARAGERKLGETCWRAPDSISWEQQIGLARVAGVRFVLLGVPEHIGVCANHGVAGADGAWPNALVSFANVQSNRFLTGEDVWIAGACELRDLNARASAARGDAGEIRTLRSLVSELDRSLEAILLPLFTAGLHPIIVGGGNNNSLPILRALAKSARRRHPDARVHALNCDPHADFRPLEGRHSGNAFRYAVEEGVLDCYFALLLHCNYNSETMLRAMDEANAGLARVGCNGFDDVLEGRQSLAAALDEGLAFITGGDATGLELDCDAIAGFPTSAFTPSGMTVDEARRLMLRAARTLQPDYLHLSEAAPSRIADGELFVGKALSYFITDHLRAMGAASGG